jgi:hypothetical protein
VACEQRAGWHEYLVACASAKPLRSASRAQRARRAARRRIRRLPALDATQVCEPPVASIDPGQPAKSFDLCSRCPRRTQARWQGSCDRPRRRVRASGAFPLPCRQQMPVAPGCPRSCPCYALVLSRADHPDVRTWHRHTEAICRDCGLACTTFGAQHGACMHGDRIR